MTLKEIVKQWIKERGFEGLWREGCACKLDNLMPCSEPGEDCEAGYEAPCDGTCDDGPCAFHIVKEKP